MQLRILGPVGVADQTNVTEIGQPRHRALLGYLLLHRNAAVATERLIRALWGGSEPRSARTQIHIMISVLRRVLADSGMDGVVSSVPGGYRVGVRQDAVDIGIFDDHLASGRAAVQRGDWAEGTRRARAGLAVWEGEPFAGVKAAFVTAARHRLRQRWLDAYQLLAECELQQGNDESLISEVGWLVEEYPTRERLVRQLMLAQYRADRRTDALATARWWRDVQTQQQGLDPGCQFVELEMSILRGDRGPLRHLSEALGPA